MGNVTLAQAALFLGAAVFAAPIAKRLGIGSVLGYLLAGMLIGPYGLGLVYSLYQVESILHLSEFGVVLLLFLIGLELRPKRLWAMRKAVFGLGGAQVLLTGLALGTGAVLLGLPIATGALVGLALALSSTAFALQVLEEKRELKARHGRLAFSVLLFQDLAAIPLIALVPIFAVGSAVEQSLSLLGAAKGIGVILLVVIAGRFVLRRLFPLVAATGVREAMTASALLTVVGVTLLMESAGLSAVLGAFIAGALLADSDYRHELEANIAPFEGLLLGLFFTAIGMSLNLELLLHQPVLIAGLVLGLIGVKSFILFLLGRWQGLSSRPARRLALAICQGGEFAFVIFAVATKAQALSQDLSGLLAVVVTLSMMATPLLLTVDSLLQRRGKTAAPQYDDMPKDENHVIVAGFGRFGQIVARVLRAKGIRFTALDISAQQVDFVRKFGNQIYYGDASRLEILEAAKTESAKAFVLAIDDVEASLKTAALVRRHFPDLPIFARARDRQHAHRLLDLGTKVIRRETFYSALDLTREVLAGLGATPGEASRSVELFRKHDLRRLYDDYRHYSDEEKLQSRAREATEELEELFAQDIVAEEPTENSG